MNNFNLETERLSIRRFLPADGGDLAEILTDYETVFYEPYEPFSEHQAVAEAEKFYQDESFYCFYAMLRDEFLK
ncbi:MAG: hypothetical protein IJ642_07010 [Oscillospiraceae bacterium]|nr:hypothetical protein [Oscillospiraceae bacterium]